ncbi:MAG: type III pantothenate kinase [Sneathiellaceae bacterium]
MLLGIDAGNTNITFAVFDGDDLRAEWRITTDNGRRTSDEYAVWLTQLMTLKGIGPADIHAAIVCSVVPPVMFALKRLCRDYFDADPLVVGEPDCRLEIQVHAQGAGADRLVNAVGAHLVTREPKIVIDFGTATTLDVVDDQGNYCGGVIAAGVNLNLDALHRVSAMLPRITAVRPPSDNVIGTDTIGAMRSGVYWGYVSMIEGLTTRIMAEFGRPMVVMATGGLAPLFGGATDAIQIVAGDLTMRGLREIYRRNGGK